MNAKECRDASRRLSALLDRQLTPWEESRVREHLAACSHCRGEWEGLRDVRGALGTVPTPPLRSDALQRIRAALRGKQQPAWVPVVCAMALLMVAGAFVQQQLAGRETARGPMAQARASIPRSLQGPTALAAPRPQAFRTVAKVATEPQPKAHEAATRSANKARRPADRRARGRAPAPPAVKPGSHIVIAVSEGAPATAQAPVLRPGAELVVTRIQGEDGEPDAQLAIGRIIGEDLRVERVLIAYCPISHDETDEAAGEEAGSAEEETDGTKPEDTMPAQSGSFDDGARAGSAGARQSHRPEQA